MSNIITNVKEYLNMIIHNERTKDITISERYFL